MLTARTVGGQEAHVVSVSKLMDSVVKNEKYGM
jgi:hypothetical protein